MVKLPVSLLEFMGDPNISISSSPFAPGKVIVKRASFPKGKTPPHLARYAIKPGECKGQYGTVIHKGKLMPKTAACVAKKHGK